MKIVRVLAMITASLALFASTGFAAEENAEVAGVPAYSVTRLKIYEGSAWVRTPDSGDWEEFSSNSPVPVRSLVSIPEGSEAELQFHGGQFVLLTGGTEVSLLRVENERTAFGLRSGEIRFYLPDTDFAPVSVTAPGGGRADFSVPGRYWMTADQGGETTLVVRQGEGTVSVERGAFPVKAGEQASFREEVRIGKYEGGAYEGGARDSFEESPPLSDAERQAGVPPSAASELRDYGEWVYSTEYGYVWRPRVSQDWSPYYYGRWVWISPYGWTWVSYEPWGWYPYHYGYWYTDPIFGWVWYPFHSFISFSFGFGHHHYPHYHGHAYYYPARVRFIHDGRNVRWVPLRPGERTGRIAYTRSDTRLTSWQRPLARETVYVRGKGDRSRDWRDWTADRRERTVSVGTRGAPRRGEPRPAVRSGDRISPRPGVRGKDRSTRPPDERSRNLRETERPARESPPTQERRERITPSSPRPERRSGIGSGVPRVQTRAERYGDPVRSPARPSSAVRSSPTQERRERITPSSPRPERRSGIGSGVPRVQTQAERYGDPVRSPARPSSAVRSSPPQERQGTRSVPRYRAMPAGRENVRGSDRRAAPAGQMIRGGASGVRSSAPTRLEGVRGNFGRGGGSGLPDFGARGGRGFRSVR